MTTKKALLKKIKEKISKLKHTLPINLDKDAFELSNGGTLTQLNEDDVTYEIKSDFEEFYTEYENLSFTDLEQILSIMDNEIVDDEKAFKRSQSY
jgi:hypothetical protein